MIQSKSNKIVKLKLHFLIVIILSFFVFITNSIAYEVDVLWEQPYGGVSDDYANELLVTHEGDIVVVGTTLSFGSGNRDVYLLKTNSNGTLLWDNTFGTSQYEYGNAVALTTDNGFVIAGWKSYEPWINYAKLLLIKADSGGNKVWSNEFTYDTGIYANSVVEALDAGYVAVGSCHKSNSSKAGLLKTDSTGNKVWLKVYDSPLSYSEYATHIERTPDGGFILCGRESDNTGRGFLLKTDQSNDLQWREIYFNNSHGLVFTCVRLVTDGNYIVCGYTHWNYHYDGYIAEIDNAGNMLWSREYDLKGKDELFTSIIETNDNEYVISGYLEQPYKAFCLKINSFGNIVWEKLLQNATSATDLVKIDNRTFLVTGKTNYLGAGDEDIYLAKIQEPIISTPLLYAEPNELIFVSSLYYNQPIIQTAEIYNQGIGVLNWRIQEDCNWLDVTPTSGSSIGDINKIQLSIDKTGLDVGTYTYDVQVVDSNAANSPYIINVRLIVHGYTVNVPDEFDTIQQAIDAVSDGDTVIIGPGIYEGEGNYDIDFKGKAITVRGANPDDPNVVALTIIDGSSISDIQYRNGFYFHSNEDTNSMLVGVSITGFVNGSGINISNARPVIRKCRLYGNNNGINASFSLSDKLDTLISDCIITRNEGVGIGVGNADVKIDNCIIENNARSGINSFGGCGGGIGDLILENCSFSQNGYIGLDFRSHSGLVSINKCSIIGNKGDNGGGICSSGYLNVENTIISGNYSTYGGAAVVFYGPIILSNCTITGNYTERDYVISCNSYVGAQIRNSIIRDNYPNSEIGFRGNQHNYVSYCNIEDGISAIHLNDGAILNWETGNIDRDPCFVWHGYWDANGVWIEGNYHLLPSSPCIDAGDPNYIDDPNDTDLDGKPRVIGGRIDMGAYECGPSIPTEVSIVPNTINLSSRGNWIICYIWLPEEHNIADIDHNSIFINYKIQAESVQVNEQQQVATAKFSRSEVQNILDIGTVELTIFGWLTDGTRFQGTDVIKVIYEVGGKLTKYSKAGNPNPPDGATGVDIYADLSWTPGYKAESHDVYFGTANPPPFIGNQIAATFDPGTMTCYTTYYWRIDEVNKWSITTGDIWSFTTGPPPPPPPPQPPPPPPP